MNLSGIALYIYKSSFHDISSYESFVKAEKFIQDEDFAVGNE